MWDYLVNWMIIELEVRFRNDTKVPVKCKGKINIMLRSPEQKALEMCLPGLHQIFLGVSQLPDKGNLYINHKMCSIFDGKMFLICQSRMSKRLFLLFLSIICAHHLKMKIACGIRDFYC